MENVHASIDEDFEEGFELLWGPGQLGVVVLLFPLREAQDDRNVRADGLLDLGDDFSGKGRTLNQGAAILVFALVHHVPEELVDEITMRAVNLDRVEAKFPGAGCGLCIGGNHVGDFRFARFFENLLALMRNAGWAVGGSVRIMTGTAFAQQALMPDLRGHLAAFAVDCIDDFLPASKGRFGVEERVIGIIGRALARDQCAFGDDQADISRCTARIIIDDILGWHAVGAEAAGHWGHDDTVRKLERFELERFE